MTLPAQILSRPIVTFTAVPDPLDSQMVRFDNQSRGVEAYEWDFGDGTLVNTASPEHRYEKPDFYTVTLSAYPIGSYAAIRTSRTVIVLPGSTPVELPVEPVLFSAGFTWTPDPTDALTIHFEDDSLGNVAQRYWRFADGTRESGSDLANVTHTYEKPDNYLVSLVVVERGTGLKDRFEQTITIPNKPTEPDELPTQGLTANFESSLRDDQRTYEFRDASTGGTPGWWHWDFGDGSTDDDPEVTHAFDDPGSYVVLLLVSSHPGGAVSAISKEVVIPLTADDVKVDDGSNPDNPVEDEPGGDQAGDDTPDHEVPEDEVSGDVTPDDGDGNADGTMSDGDEAGDVIGVIVVGAPSLDSPTTLVDEVPPIVDEVVAIRDIDDVLHGDGDDPRPIDDIAGGVRPQRRRR